MTQQAQDGAELADFGYKQELERTLGNFHTFAAGISYISILTGTFQLFYLGFALGGPTYWWSWPMVFLGQLMVALCFAELAAHYPVAGSIYNWSKRLSNPHVSWLAGWMMLTASIVTIAAVALAYQLTLPQIWSGFQVIGDGDGKYDFAANAVLLGTVLIIFTTVVNAFGVKLMAQINSTGVFIDWSPPSCSSSRSSSRPRVAPTSSSRPRAAATGGSWATWAHSLPPRSRRPTSCTGSTPRARSARRA